MLRILSLFVLAALCAHGREDKLLELLMQRARNGEPVAQYYLGMRYLEGRGVVANKSEATRWIRKSAEQGFPPAQFDIGIVFLSGDGVPRDPAEAAKWMRASAEQGFAVAQKNLGLMFARGDGVPLDLVQAYVWLAVAEKTQKGVTGTNRAAVEKHLTPAQLSDGKKKAKEVWRSTSRTPFSKPTSEALLYLR